MEEAFEGVKVRAVEDAEEGWVAGGDEWRAASCAAMLDAGSMEIPRVISPG